MTEHDAGDGRTYDLGGARQKAQDFLPPPEGSPLPAWIAGYRILRKLGEGGMGVVYEAEQQEPRRSVALKVIRGGSAVDDHMVRLFQREAQSLARLKHPGIAAIHEAGRTEDGQRYIVMELVQGIPLDAYLVSRSAAAGDERAWLKERLALFLEICEAINYAHQKGVIHRDIKPGNILVQDASESGGFSGTGSTAVRIKILDFGLARITEPDAIGATALTEFGQIQGSLPYMSPEQAGGLPDEIDLRADVYALGVILYEMLTRQRPYEVVGRKIHEAVRVIIEEPPRHPSACNRLLRGDLETILLKALEKDPGHRYQNVIAFAEDIERYLTDQPILARPPSATYQLRKLIRRHKGAFASAAVLVALLVGFGITMSVMFERQRAERLRADAERDEAEQINAFLQQMLSSIDPEKARGREVTVREVLDEAARKAETGFAEQPEVEAGVRSTIGLTYMALGRYDEAEPHLRRALAMRDSLLGENDPEVASSANDLAALLLRKGEADSALPLFERALANQRRLLGSESAEVATSLEDLSLLLKEKGEYARAESLGEAALEIRRKVLGEKSPEVASSLSNLAALLQAQGKGADAESCCREALAVRRSLYGDRHPDIALSLNNLAMILQDQGRYAEAEPLMREALDTGRQVLGEGHPSVASAMNNLAMLLGYEGKHAEAEGLYREALALYGRQLGAEHPYIASTLNNLGSALQAQGRDAEAEQAYRQALEMRRHLLGREHPAVATTLNNLAMTLADEGKLEQAEPLYREALTMRRRLLGDRHPHVANSLLGLGSLLLKKGDAVGAEPLLRECLAIRASGRAKDDWQVAAAGSALGECLAMQRQFAEAESLLVAGERILSASAAVPAPRKREALSRVIHLYASMGKPERAAEYRARLGLLQK